MHERVSRVLLFSGSIAAMVAVALGAFGAHGLKNSTFAEMLTIYETAVRYQMYHAFGLIVTGLACRVFPSGNFVKFQIAGWLFGIGMVLFCGSLYLLVLLDLPWLGVITPLGGLAFMGGWATLAVCFWKRI